MGTESENDIEESAKKIYLGHEGSSFFMARAGLYETYRQFEISREREMQWGKEENGRLLEEFLANGLLVDITYSKLINLIMNCGDLESLRVLLDSIRSEMENLDTLTLALIAHGIIKLMNSRKHSGMVASKELLEEEYALAETLLKRASTIDFSVAPTYCSRSDMKRLVSEDNVRERINRGFRDLDAYKASTESKTGNFWRWLRNCVGRPQKEA